MKDRRALRRERPAPPSPRQTNDFLHRVFTEFPLPVIIHDERNQILLMSRGWTQFSGYTLKDARLGNERSAPRNTLTRSSQRMSRSITGSGSSPRKVGRTAFGIS